MTRAERLARIVEKLRIEGSVSVKNLSKEMNVSEPTIRRDLAEIAENLELPVIRVHGGLILDIQKGGIEPLFEAKLSNEGAETKNSSKSFGVHRRWRQYHS